MTSTDQLDASTDTVWCKEDPTFTIFGADYRERCRELAALSPVVRFAEGGIIVAGIEAADQVMHDPITFSSGPDAVFLGSEEGLIPVQIDPPAHTAYRRRLDPLFSPRRMAALEPGLVEHTNACIDRFVGSGSCEVVADLTSPVPGGAILALLGAPVERLADFLEMKADIFRPAGAPGSPERDAQVARGAANVYGLFGELLDARTADGGGGEDGEPADDMATHLVRLQAEGVVDRRQALDICMMLMLAGLDTITTSVTNMLYELARRSELRERLVREPELIPAAVEELLRYVTPIPTLPRVATADAVVSGCPIKKGERIAVWFPATNWDPASYENPDEIDLDRPVNRHMSFGVGKHRCLGSHLARIEMTVLLREWHRRIPEYRVRPGHVVRWSKGGREIAALPLEFPVP